MKTGKHLLIVSLGIWSAFTSFISPVWLTLVFLYLSGLIYQHDFSMDEGAAGILGIFGLVLWILIVLLPDIFLLKQAKSINPRYAILIAGIMIFFMILCFAMCGWNIVRFLTTPICDLVLS